MREMEAEHQKTEKERNKNNRNRKTETGKNVSKSRYPIRGISPKGMPDVY